MSDDAAGSATAEKGLAGANHGVASFDDDSPGPIRRLQAFLHAYPTAIPFIVLIVSVDGGCPGVANVKDGVIGATSQQYPLLMASMAMEAIKKFAETGEKPAVTEGLDFFDTGAALVTDKPVTGVESIDTTKGAELCWG